MSEPSGRELWLIAGQTLLRRGGIAAVKLHALAGELGLTTGSFYHHFSGMKQYLDELAHYYGITQPETNLEQLGGGQPLERLRGLAAFARNQDMARLAAAMRDWAGSNKAAAKAVEDADAILLRFMTQAFLDLGHPERDARVRALLLLAVGVARVHPPWPVDARLADDVLDLLA